MLADHGYFLNRRSLVTEPAVFLKLLSVGDFDGKTEYARQSGELTSKAKLKLQRLTTPASARFPAEFLPYAPHERDMNRHAPAVLSRVVDYELEAYAALTSTLSAATLQLPVAAAVMKWSDAHRAAAAAVVAANTDGLGEIHQQQLDTLESKRGDALTAMLGASVRVAISHEKDPRVALITALKDLPSTAMKQLDTFVPRFYTKAPEILATAPGLTLACFPAVQTDMLRTIHDAISLSEEHQVDRKNGGDNPAIEEAATANGETTTYVVPGSFGNRRLMDGPGRHVSRLTRRTQLGGGWLSASDESLRAALSASLKRDASSVVYALGGGSERVAFDGASSSKAALGGASSSSAAAAAAASAAAAVDPCRGAKVVATVACAAAAADSGRGDDVNITLFWTDETRIPSALVMCSHAINTLSTLACSDSEYDSAPNANVNAQCASAATAALPCTQTCTSSLGTVRSACNALVPRSQHGRFIEESSAGDACRAAVTAAHDECSSSDIDTHNGCAALLEAMPQSLSHEFSRSASHYPTWWEEQDAWGVIPRGLGTEHFHAIHLAQNKLMGRVPQSIWSTLHPEATTVMISHNKFLEGDVPGPLAHHVRRVYAANNRLGGNVGEIFAPAAATGSLVSVRVSHNRFSAPDGLEAFARLGAHNLESFHVNHNDFAPSEAASRALPAHVASMMRLRTYSLSGGNRWSFSAVAEGASELGKTLGAGGVGVPAGSGTAYTSGAHHGSDDTPMSSVDVQLTFPTLTSASFCSSCDPADSDTVYLPEYARQFCVDRLVDNYDKARTNTKSCGDEALFTAVKCILRELLSKRILAEAQVAEHAVVVSEIADTSSGHAAVGLRVTLKAAGNRSSTDAAAAVAKALERHRANGSPVRVSSMCITGAGSRGRTMAAPDALPTVSARRACPIGSFGPRCDYFCVSKWSKTNTAAAFRGHHPWSSRAYTPRPHPDSPHDVVDTSRTLHPTPTVAGNSINDGSEGEGAGRLGHSDHSYVGSADAIVPHITTAYTRHGYHAPSAPPKPRCSIEESRMNFGDHLHCDRRLHRHAYKYVPKIGDPDEGQHTPSTNFGMCQRNCAGFAKRAVVECNEWMDDKSHPGERKRCREGLVDMMRECKLYKTHSEVGIQLLR
jgi:hypothetical protein